MLNIFNHTITGMSFWLSHHTTLAYITLFLGSYFETLIGPGFFIYGEAFFLPGAILAGTGILNIWFVAFWLILGGLLGDTSSYFIGREFGARLFKENNRFFSLTNYEKGANFFAEYGAKSVFFARLLGPLSWITPFFAGTYKVSYSRFLMFNIPGVFIGIGEFLVVGYFFGRSYQKALAIIQGRLFVTTIIAIIVLVLYYVWKRNDPDFFSGGITLKGFWRRYITKKA